MTPTKMWLRAGALVAAVVLVASACSGGGSDDGSNNEGSGESTDSSVELTFWSRDSQSTFIQPIIDAFNSSHEDIQVKVTVVPSAQFVQKFGTAAASGSGPDVISLDLVYGPYFSQAGALVDITDRLGELDYVDLLSPTHMRLGAYEDRQFALPFSAEASVLYYNKDLFEQAGLDPEQPPTTWQEIADAAAAISALGDEYSGFYFSGGCGGCNVFTFAPLIWASGADIMDADGVNPTFDDPVVGEALQFYRGMWQDGVMDPSVETDNGASFGGRFGDGKLGMVSSGAFYVGQLKTDFPDLNFGVTPMPGRDGGTSAFVGGDIIAMVNGTKNEDAAWEFLKWATGDEAQTLVSDAGVVPTRTDIASTVYSEADPRFAVQAEQMGNGDCPYSVVENALINDANGPWSRMIQEAVFGDGDIADIQATYQAEAEQIVSQGPGN